MQNIVSLDPSWRPFRDAGKKTERKAWLYVVALSKTRKVITTKKGEKMAFILIEDYVSKAEIVVFPKLFAQVEEWLSTHTVFIVKGIVDSSTQATKLKAQALIPIDLLFFDTR